MMQRPGNLCTIFALVVLIAMIEVYIITILHRSI